MVLRSARDDAERLNYDAHETRKFFVFRMIAPMIVIALFAAAFVYAVLLPFEKAEDLLVTINEVRTAVAEAAASGARASDAAAVAREGMAIDPAVFRAGGIASPYGTKIAVTGGARTWTLALGGVPAAACRKAAFMVSSEPDFVSLSVNGSAADPTRLRSAAAARRVCDRGMFSAGNAMTIAFAGTAPR